MTPDVVIVDDPDSLAERATELIVQASVAAVAERGRFTLVLSGGSTPEKTYQRLAEARSPAALDWSKTYLFFGDERFVPHDDSRSNYSLVQHALLDRAAIAADHVVPIDTTGTNAAACAAVYAQQLEQFFDRPPSTLVPEFDLVLLGLGDDGHTASLFPGAAALQETERWVIASPPGVLPPPVDRITMTYPLLNRARHVLFLVSGSNKAEPLRDVLGGTATRDTRPAAGICPSQGRVTWIIDRAAASLLPNPRSHACNSE